MRPNFRIFLGMLLGEMMLYYSRVLILGEVSLGFGLFVANAFPGFARKQFYQLTGYHF